MSVSFRENKVDITIRYALFFMFVTQGSGADPVGGGGDGSLQTAMFPITNNSVKKLFT